LRLWDIEPYPSRLRLQGQSGLVSGLAFSPSGDVLITTGPDGARLWETDTGNLRMAVPVTATSPAAVVFSPDGKLFATGNVSGTTTLWDTQTGQPILQLSGHAGAIVSVAFSPDGSRLATAGTDDVGTVWDIQTGQVLARLSHPVGLSRIGFSHDGAYLFTAGLHVRRWQLQAEAQPNLVEIIAGAEARVNDFAASPDGRFLVTAGEDGIVRLWDIEAATAGPRLLGHEDSVLSVAFSPDGQMVASASSDGTARLWDIATGLELRRFLGHTAPVHTVAITPDGTLLANVGDDGLVSVWDVDYHDTIRYVCERLARDLTRNERIAYNIPIGSPTCP
jgi:WD40 repeat protein